MYGLWDEQLVAIQLLFCCYQDFFVQDSTKRSILVWFQSSFSSTYFIRVQVRRRRSYAGKHWRSNDELISDVFLWSPTHRRSSIGRPAKIYISYIQKKNCRVKHLFRLMDNWDGWWEMRKEILALSATWLYYINIYMYACMCVGDVCVCVCVYL